jgi:hypothetical protein
MAGGNLATIGKAGFLTCGVLSVNDRNLMAVLQKIPGRRRPNDASAHHDNMHTGKASLRIVKYALVSDSRLRLQYTDRENK